MLLAVEVVAGVPKSATLLEDLPLLGTEPVSRTCDKEHTAAALGQSLVLGVEQVLFEFTGLRLDTPPRREAGEGTAPTLAARTRGGGGLGTDAECDGAVIAEHAGDCSPHVAIAFSARARGDDGRGYDRPEQVFGEVVGTLDTMKPHNVAISPSHGLPVSPSQSPAYAVRRLTPKEYERFQGFPDDYTLIPWRGKPADLCPDGPRYKALGNSMAVPVMHWIGARLCAYLCQ